jgi:PAS domain S-box-containing protein
MVRENLQRGLEAILDRKKSLADRARELSARGDADTAAVLDELVGDLERLGDALDQLRGKGGGAGAGEGAAAEGEGWYRDLFDFAPDAYVVTDAEGTIREGNLAVADMLQERLDVLVGRPLVDYVAADDRTTFISMLDEIRQPGKIRDEAWEVYMRPRGGVLFPASVSASAFCDDDGRVVRVRWMVHDISELKRAEEALELQRDRAQKFLNVAEVMLVALNRRGEITMINRKGCRILGYEEAELIGEDWFEKCLPERVKDPVRRIFDQLFAGETEPVEYGENPVVTKSGEARIIAWHNTVLRNEHGYVTGTLSSGEDVTERKQARERVRESEAILAKAQEMARLGIWHLDLETRAVKWSDEVFRIFGVSSDEFSPTYEAVLERIHPDDADKAAAAVQSAIKEGRAYDLESRVLRPDGTVRRVHAKGEVLSDEAGEPVKLVGTIVDVTEQASAPDDTPDARG